MIIFFVLINFSQTLHLIIDKIYRNYRMFEYNSLQTVNCELVDEDKFIFRGRFTNIIDILIKEKNAILNNRKIKGYKYIYFPDNYKYNDYAHLFSNSSIFVIPYEQVKNNNCHILLNLKGLEDNYESGREPYYLSINKKTLYSAYYRYDDVDLFYECFIPIFIFLSCVYFCKLYYCSIRCYNLQFYVFTRRLMILCIPLIVSNSLMKYILFIGLFHSLYKSYILINLIFLLDGNSILKFENINPLYRKYLLMYFIMDGFLNILFSYVVYFIPPVNNFYYDTFKNLIVHIALLIYTYKSYDSNYFHFYNQYLFEIRLKSILSLFYIFKNVMYQKVIKFSFLYSCIFIGFQIYKMIFLKDFADAFYINYTLNTGLELFLVFILVKMFFPQNLSIFYFMPIVYDYNSKIYKVQITNEENKLNISNLNKNILKDEYQKNKTPLVFISPFSKSNKDFNNIYIGENINHNYNKYYNNL